MTSFYVTLVSTSILYLVTPRLYKTIMPLLVIRGTYTCRKCMKISCTESQSCSVSISRNNMRHQPPTRGLEQPCTHTTHTCTHTCCTHILYNCVIVYCRRSMSCLCSFQFSVHSSVDHKKITTMFKLFPAIFLALVMVLSERKR